MYNNDIEDGFKKKKTFNKPRTKMIETKEIEKLLQSYEKIDAASIKKFTDFPLSQKSQKGLRDSGYLIPTDIQRESVGLALKGQDILGAAKTGSGKTIAFLLPVLEKLYLKRWTAYDGLGALIITPTRELAYQIFEVLRKVGAYHDFSAGLIIGGKDLKFERKRMDKCNIIICTPGRLLQHMDENPLFDSNNLQILVLDEADQILDLGFQKTINAIIENLPQERQTLLFSATQTRSVKDLARLSLHYPVYVSVHEHAAHKTPEMLQQSYVVCELYDKLNLLWSFIKTHLKQKILVFMASCKQVKYAYESFCRMRPGMTVLALYGSLHQLKRMAIYDEFCRKRHAVLFATDIASRGLDFPSVNWVFQIDCPEDVKTYIHRVGRTARYEGNGEALLVLLPSEELMARKLTENQVPISQISINTKKFLSVQRKLEVLCSRDRILKESAQRAFVSYLKSVFLMKDKSVFQIKSLDTDAFARSLGLAVSPRIRFLARQQKKEMAALHEKKTMENIRDTMEEMKELMLHSDSDDNDDEDLENNNMLGMKSLSQKPFDFHGDESDDDDDDDVLIPKTIQHVSDDSDEQCDEQVDKISEGQIKIKTKVLTKSAVAKKLLKKKVKPNTKVVFDEEGKPMEKFPTKQKSRIAQELQKSNDSFNLELAQQIMREEDKIDKQLYRERVRALHREKKMKLKEEKKKLQEQNDLEKVVSANVNKDQMQDDDFSASEDETLAQYIDELPDPDVIKNSDNEQTTSDDEEELSCIKTTPDRKRRLQECSSDRETQPSFEYKCPSKKKKSKEKFEKNNEEPLDTGLSLFEDEELALHFLSQQ